MKSIFLLIFLIGTGWPAWGRLSLPTPTLLRAAPGGPMRLIDCSTPKFPNTFAMVDDEDFEYLSQWKWYAMAQPRRMYAVRNNNDGENTRLIYMHREVIEIQRGLGVDHIDHNGLNNTRGNLRPATKSENGMNSRKQLSNKSGYIGVYWHAKSKKWMGRIEVSGKCIYLGLNSDIMVMARIRDAAAIKYHGEFAVLNMVPA